MPLYDSLALLGDRHVAGNSWHSQDASEARDIHHRGCRRVQPRSLSCYTHLDPLPHVIANQSEQTAVNNREEFQANGAVANSQCFDSCLAATPVTFHNNPNQFL
ncbi:hypothetical protein CSOJ01_10891 [Colletotrichum sojae]|uniref:Uncharacterized protein n=1 Tax=Colletotrichum sojae TaxID=2175907 RepID=A0A8H6IYY6_9PEZI|nr:hypothetical protein CSOJ01_10891 [Colletotrichum sojae]